MPVVPMPHPDRAAATLANLVPAVGQYAPPGAGAADCRIDLKLLQWRAAAAIARSRRSRDHLGSLTPEAHPDLWAGTVPDGVARGFAVRLEECLALADADAPAAATGPTPAGTTPPRTTTGKELRKRKDLLVASGGARVRFTRKEGVLFVDRDARLHSANCLWFEARRDLGTLDGFVADPTERPRLFSAQFLQPREYRESDTGQQLVLAGRLGRGPVGWNVELTLRGRADADHVELALVLDQRMVGWRLRARFLGLPPAAIAHDCTPVHEHVATDAGGFVACTLVRACTRLQAGERIVDVPGAASCGALVHTFRLGAQPA
ncbi:MAG: hypothetical protein JNK15_19150 [Planctomycetes bacterium]|nr:hypothetical protein [Planctomycetota bacterium]